MKKVVPNGELIKEIRQQRTEGSLQKEMAFAVRISCRQLRLIENSNQPVTIAVLERIASYLAVPKDRIAFAIDAPRLVPLSSKDVVSIVPELAKDRLIPRHEEEYATASMDEGALLRDASNSHDMKVHIDTKLTDETTDYVQELTGILSSLTWAERDILEDIPATEEVALRRRIRQLLVLLKGNDVWLTLRNTSGDCLSATRSPQKANVPALKFASSWPSARRVSMGKCRARCRWTMASPTSCPHGKS